MSTSVKSLILESNDDSVDFWEKCFQSFLQLALKEDPKTNAEDRKALLEKMVCRFPGSKRVATLMLVNLEADSMLKSAFAGYLALGKTDSFGRKRILDLHRKAGDPISLVEALCEYLSLFLGDEEAWAELAKVYAAQGELKKCIFCSEEVLLARPNDQNALCNHGDWLLASGDAVMARKYFCRAAELDVKNARALLGIKKSLLSHGDGQEELMKWVDRKLNEVK